MIIYWLSGRRGPSRKRSEQALVALALLAALLGAPFARRLEEELRGHEPIGRFVRACGWVLRVSAFTAVLLGWVEGYSPVEAAWQVWQTATTVGYGNQPEVTVLGRLLVMLLGTIDIALVGSMISAAFGVKDYLEQFRRYGYMPNPHKNAYVLIHSPGERDLKIFIRGLRATDPDAPVCVVDGAMDELPPDIRVLPGVHFVKGSALNPSVLERANVAQARAVVVYAINKDLPDSDAATLTVVKQLWGMPGTFGINYLLVEPANERLFLSEFLDAKLRGRPRPAAIPRHMATMAAVQALHAPLVGETLASLVYADNGSGFHTARMRLDEPTTWMRVVQGAQEVAAELDVAVNTVSLTPHGAAETIVCPRPSAAVRDGDHVVFVSTPGIDWTRFHQRLAENLVPTAPVRSAPAPSAPANAA